MTDTIKAIFWVGCFVLGIATTPNWLLMGCAFLTWCLIYIGVIVYIENRKKNSDGKKS